eukprot:CAMPEP_0179010286 /NCGR_PEP_ID=MMETSP0796-20121207/22_1 /TAXON_ID=73915 /ORGANISM="Pyrodinium bahamense, Strain pbaha01" /LENGTH=51 /DNA_ID=CAMNT_0020705533 /DNA_START=331 /DNA_END=483 /DNA_ORIENTATION=-
MTPIAVLAMALAAALRWRAAGATQSEISGRSTLAASAAGGADVQGREREAG